MLIYNARDKSAPLYSGGSYLCVPGISDGNRRSYHFCLPAAAFVTNTKTHNDEKWLTNRCHSRNTEGGGEGTITISSGVLFTSGQTKRESGGGVESWAGTLSLSRAIPVKIHYDGLLKRATRRSRERAHTLVRRHTHARTHARAREQVRIRANTRVT